jgi:hypothetical protein
MSRINSFALKDNKLSILLGVTIIAIGSYTLISNLNLFYKYHFTGILFLFMYPDWILITNSFLGFIEIIIGLLILFNRIMKNKAIIFSLILIVITILLKITVWS